MTRKEAIFKARKLLKLTKSKNRNEAQTARRLLQRLVRKHKINQQELQPSTRKSKIVISRQPPQAVVRPDQTGKVSL